MSANYFNEIFGNSDRQQSKVGTYIRTVRNTRLCLSINTSRHRNHSRSLVASVLVVRNTSEVSRTDSLRINKQKKSQATFTRTSKHLFRNDTSMFHLQSFPYLLSLGDNNWKYFHALHVTNDLTKAQSFTFGN